MLDSVRPSALLAMISGAIFAVSVAAITWKLRTGRSRQDGRSEVLLISEDTFHSVDVEGQEAFVVDECGELIE